MEHTTSTQVIPIADREKCIEALGIYGVAGSFDWAIPQDFFERCINATKEYDYPEGFNPSGNVVWCYDYTNQENERKESTFGFPLAVTPLGAYILATVLWSPHK